MFHHHLLGLISAWEGKSIGSSHSRPFVPQYSERRNFFLGEEDCYYYTKWLKTESPGQVGPVLFRSCPVQSCSPLFASPKRLRERDQSPEMVSKRQKEARKVFKAANPDLFPKPVEKDPSLTATTKKKKKKNGRKKKNDPTKSSLKANSDDGVGKNRNKNPLRKHPLRVPGMKPGESCFICKGMDHIAKLCPKKSDWERNKTCLHCRQRGHSLKNCPEKAENAERKYCYNCGEAGHSLSNCTHPLQDGGTRYASCFICNEQGHLSKNCPKNTHGIYPKGGSCKICDGVTHLAKDCPNKGSRGGAVSASGRDNTSKKQAEQWNGKLTVFRSGDDLEDDFT